MERFPIETEELQPDEAHQVEVYYVEPQELVQFAFDKKGKHKHGKHHGSGAGKANNIGPVFPRGDEGISEYDARRALANGDPDRIADINRLESFHSTYSSERHYRPYSG